MATKISEMSQEAKDKLLINLCENIKKYAINSPEYLNQLRVISMLSKQQADKLTAIEAIDIDTEE